MEIKDDMYPSYRLHEMWDIYRQVGFGEYNYLDWTSYESNNITHYIEIMEDGKIFRSREPVDM